ncbi:sensor histidine kinase [Enteractinococcus coprophilus]|uniref:sensor histidine kinase n=1 Tax=Enteractinococcus coprophilus TaxID=1027633 RepID=UPI00114DD47E|nr:HAMP domain-containing sensor histidine kinase [Enteractinococcus coprophilus]
MATPQPLQWIARRWQATSLRTQLTLITGLLMALTVALTAILTASLYRQELIRQIDEDIFTNRHNVSMYLTSMGSAGPYETGSFEQTIVRFYGESWNNDGEFVTRIYAEGSDVPDIEPLTARQAAAHGSTPFNVPGLAMPQHQWRVQIYRLESDSGTVAIALPLDPVERSVERVTTLVITIGFLATLVVTMIAYGLVTTAFRPLNRVERTAAGIAAGDLSKRVPSGAPDTEVGRLSRSLNAMLAHIEIAFRANEQSEERMRRFVQDASHELRTPLVTIRGFSELYRHGALSSEEDVSTAMGRIESEAKRMTQLVEDLLTLARLDEQRTMDIDPIDLLQLASDLVLDTRATAPDRHITLTGLTPGSSPQSAPTLGDANRLRQVISNLMTNVLRYTPGGTAIEIAVGTAPSENGAATESIIKICDHGPGISDSDAEKIFQRFYRADTSRDRDTGGSGLGLAIVAGIVSQHNGTVRHEETPGGGATMVVRLPYHPMDHDDDDDWGSEDETDFSTAE